MKFIRSLLFAFRGLGYCWHQLNFRLHLLAIIFVTVAGTFYKINKLEWLAIIICCSLVLAMEMLNTAIEKLCDLFTKEINPLIKIIKDVSAGAVLVCAIGSLIIGAIIFVPKILHQIIF